jgi:NAD(P)-dependent dehydrogenase (short-subunit alcohol dehydrogenase family)
MVLITGATSGIGFATALELARRGETIAIVCRDKGRGEQARARIFHESGAANIELYLADLSSQSQIRSLAADFLSRHGRLDVLINDAATVRHERVLTEDGFETQFAVNHLAYFLLTRLLLDILKASAPARIVNVASGAHRSGKVDFENLQGEKKYKPLSVYATTKLCNVLFTQELGRRLAGTGVTANCLGPGLVSTRIPRDFGLVPRLFFKAFGKRPARGAETVVHLATSAEVANVTGEYFENCRIAPVKPRHRDPELARRLWEISEKLTGLPALNS